MKLSIDLGTSYSSVATEIKGKIEMIKVATGTGAFGDSFSMPTAVYIDNGHIVLGQAALNKRKLSPACFKSEFKRDFGTSTPYIIGGEEYLPEQLYTEFFLYFKNQAAEQTGEKVERVCITHPANYGNNKKRLIEKAANNAGFFDVVLVDEPTAAAAGYSQKSRISNGDILLVYDLGGGTFDVAIIKKTTKGYVHLTEPLGISQCGGIDFDRVIFDDIMEKMSQDGSFDMERLIKEKRFTAALSEICIQIKHQLSQAESHTEPIAVGFDYFEYTITRQEFENMIGPFVASTCEKVKDILKNSGIVASDIDRVLLVGGSSRVPLVRKMVQETLQKDISFDADPELAVCQGAVSLGILVQEDVQDKREEQEQSQGIKAEHQAKESIILQKSGATESPSRMEEILTYVVLGIYASDGEWIYYVGREDNHVLCKTKIDGTQKIKLSNHSIVEGKIKIEDEWIYYNVRANNEGNGNYYRIRKDGSGETIINKDYNSGVYGGYGVKDGWIYFVNASKNLTKMCIDGSCVTHLGHDQNVSNVTMEKDWIYYSSSFNNDNNSLCRICIDGTKKTELRRWNGFINYITVFDEWVLYNTVRTEKKMLWQNTLHELWKIHGNGTSNCKVSDNFDPRFSSHSLNIIKGWLYYDIYKYDMTHRMRLDGTGKQEVSLNMLQQEIAAMKEPK